MPSNYPASNDSFIEPSLPEETPLSSAGSGNKSHWEHHRDAGDAIEKIQEHAAVRTHDHSGTGPRSTPKLDAANTHQNVAVDTSPSDIHHTLGTGPNKAAPGDHKHNAIDIIGMGWMIVANTAARPANPPLGMTIYQLDLHAVFVWDTFPPATVPSWRLIPVAARPICRLRQGTAQKINTNAGNVIEWRTEEEDNWGMFNPGQSMTEIVIPLDGMYEVVTSVAWNNNDIFGDWAETVILLNGQETFARNFEFIRGRSILNPGRPQTVGSTGDIRYKAGDRVGIRAKHNGSNFQWTYSNLSEKQDSRFELKYISP